MATMTSPAAEPELDTFPINGTDYIEFWVGNAKQSAMYYRAAFGFQLTAYRGPETGVRDRASYLLTQDKLRFVLTSAINSDHEIARHVNTHGDGVRDIAFWVDDARDAYKKAIERGAESGCSPAWNLLSTVYHKFPLGGSRIIQYWIADSVFELAKPSSSNPESSILSAPARRLRGSSLGLLQKPEQKQSRTQNSVARETAAERWD